MPYSLTWLPTVLRETGLKVALVDGWDERGAGDIGVVRGVLCHHTAGPRTGNMPSLGTVRDGRPGLPGPLSQLGLGRDGTFYVIAAGRCNHSGVGDWRGITNGNSSFIGIEAENTGLQNDFPWPAVQLEAYQRGVAAILKWIGQGTEFCAAHREYARPLGRKTDPTFDMEAFRWSVGEILNGNARPLVPIPAIEPAGPGGEPGRPTLRRGAEGPWVEKVQARLAIEPRGPFGPSTEAAVRAFQRDRGMVPDGIVGPKTWAAFDEATDRR